MPQMKSQHWLFGLLGAFSLSSVLYTVFVGDLDLDTVIDRRVESQKSIDTLTSDMKRFLQSISNWQAFCENPQGYLRSASSHGTFTVEVKDQWTSTDVQSMSRITREAIGRCMNDKNAQHPGQFRLCLSVRDTSQTTLDDVWFDEKRLLEVSVEFRERGAKLIPDCSHLAGKKIEVQSFFSAYTDNGPKKRSGRVSGGLRLPVESTRF